MKLILALLVTLSLLQAAEAENEFNIQYRKVFTKREITMCGYNPEVVTAMSQCIVVLPTRERILYTTISYSTVTKHKTATNSLVGGVPAGSILDSTTIVHETTSVLLSAPH